MAALRSLDPARLVAEALAESPVVTRWSSAFAEDAAGPVATPLDRQRSGDTLLVAIGDAAGPMAAGACAVLGQHLTAGVVVLPGGMPHPSLLPQIRAHVSGPARSGGRTDAARTNAARDVRSLLAGTGPGDRVLVLLSGRVGSTLIDPEPPLDETALAATLETVRDAGWDPTRAEGVRGVLDRLAGGGLADLASPAETVAIVLPEHSSPAGRGLAAAAVAPPVVTARDVEIALRRSGVWPQLARPVRTLLEAGRLAGVSTHPDVETTWIDAGDRLPAALRREAERRGYAVQSLGDELSGTGARLGAALGRAVGAAQDGLAAVPLPACLFGLGSTSRDGLPGPNQALVLGAASSLAGRQGVLLGAIALDGVDGSTDAAGGWVDGSSTDRAHAMGIDLTSAEQAGAALERLADRLVTGPTGNGPGAGDLYLALIDGSGERA